MIFSHFAHPSILCVMLLYSVPGTHPVDLFPQQQQYLHASIHSTVVIILLVVVALYVEQRYIAYFVVWLEPRYSAYLSAPISSAALRGESVSHTFRPTPSFSYSYTRKQCSEVCSLGKSLYMITRKITTNAMLMMPTITIASIHVSVSGLMVVVTDSER